MKKDKASPAAVAYDFGQRVKAARLNTNISQENLAALVGLSIKSIKNAEKGKCQFETMVAILIALGKADQLDLLLPPATVSPIQLAKLQSKQRQRASTQTEQQPTNTEVKPAW